MITASDSFNTVDLGRYYAILPSARRARFDVALPAQGTAQAGAARLRLQQRHERRVPYRGADARADPQHVHADFDALKSMHDPLRPPEITDADIEAVVEVLRSDFLTQGPAVPRFEQAVAEYCGAAHAVAVNSATSALHLACLALGRRSGRPRVDQPDHLRRQRELRALLRRRGRLRRHRPGTCNLSVAALAREAGEGEAASKRCRRW